MTQPSDKVRNIQTKVYEHLVKRGKVSPQIAESQPVSESMAAILVDAVRVAKDDNAVAEAAAKAVNMFFLDVVEEGLAVRCAGAEDGWIVYSDSLCVTNPFDKALCDQATAWARREDVAFKRIGVVASSYLGQLRAVYGTEAQGETESVDDKLALQQVEDIIRLAATQDASDVHFVPGQSDKVDLQFRIDGVLRAQRKIDLPLYETMVRAVLEQRCQVSLQTLKQQDGKFELQLNSNKSINLRVSTLPVSRRSETSPKMVMRLLGNNTSLANLTRLGLAPQNLEKLVRYGNYPNGMIVMTGPTGSGKTTGLYAQLINMQNNNPNRNFHTVEDPVEMQQPGMSHTEVTDNLTFADALRALLRQDPDVILVGEMRDNETAELGYKAAMTGHLVLTTLHTNNSHESIGRLLKMEIGIDLIVTNTTAFLAQRLVRCLCQNCKKAGRLQDDSKRLTRYGRNPVFTSLGGNTVVYQRNPSGCDKCGHTGEKGRHSIIEILEMTPDVQVALLNGMNPSILRRKQIAEGTFQDLWDDGLRLVANGTISFEQLEAELKPYEVDRVEVNATPGSGQSIPVPVSAFTHTSTQQGHHPQSLEAL
jgi:type II secretory ATPase GspE/PulE/Tfp pilus assembly ATPase PilB-like protein